jgi:hypothetical protein
LPADAPDRIPDSEKRPVLHVTNPLIEKLAIEFLEAAPQSVGQSGVQGSAGLGVGQGVGFGPGGGFGQ